MNAIYVLVIGFVVAILGYRGYAKYIDSKVIQADPNRMTPAKMYMDGVEFMPTSRNILYGYQFKSIAGAGPIIGPIIAIQWGWLPAMVWILAGTFFIGWVHDYSSAIIAMRNDGASFGGLSHRLISPRARIILLAFIYFYLLLIVGAFGNVVVSTAIGLKGSPMAWLFLTIGGVLAGQMIYRWKIDIILTTVITVGIAMIGIFLGLKAPSNEILGDSLASSRWLWAIAAFVFCYFASVLPIWRFSLPVNYVAAYIVFLGLVFGVIGVFILRPEFTLPAYTSFEIPIGPIWPIMFVTIACGAVSGWHSIVSSSGTARQLENEMDARPVGAGIMFLEMMLALFALIIAGTIYGSASEYAAAVAKGPGGVFAEGVGKFLNAVGLPLSLGKIYGSVMMIFLGNHHHAVGCAIYASRYSGTVERYKSYIQKRAHWDINSKRTGHDIGNNRLVAISLGTLWRSQSTYGFPGANARFRMVGFTGKACRMGYDSYDFHVRNHHCSVVVYFIQFTPQSFQWRAQRRSPNRKHAHGRYFAFPSGCRNYSCG